MPSAGTSPPGPVIRRKPSDRRLKASDPDQLPQDGCALRPLQTFDHVREVEMSESTPGLIEVRLVPRRAFLVSLGMVAGALHAGIRPAFAAPYQDQWARCIHCNLMFFNGYRNNKGRCAAPGRTVHEAERGDFKNYQVTYDDSTGPGQGDWRYCRKCGSLFFNGYAEKGVCAADRGGHEAA